MGSVLVEKHIDAPVQEVFATLANIPESYNTISAIEAIEMLSQGPVGVGTRWKETRVMFGREAIEEMEITEFKPNEKYVVEADTCGSHYRTEIRFEPVETGTKVAMEMKAKPMTFGAKIMAPLGWLMKGTLVKCFEKDLSDAKTACESHRHSAANASAS